MNSQLTIEREVQISAAPETVLTFLTDATKLSQWMGHSAIADARPGGILRINYNGFDIMSGEYVEVSPEKVVFTWGWVAEGAAVPAGSSKVEFTLTPEAGGTRLHLVHSNIAPGGEDHADGWDHFLPRLAIIASGNDAGVDPWTPRKAELLAGELNQQLKELRKVVAECPADAWNGARTPEGWTIAATCDHILRHSSLVGVVLATAAGTPPNWENFTQEMVDASNAQAASGAESVAKDATLAKLDEMLATMVGPLRAITDEDLQKTMSLPAFSPEPMSAEMLAQMLVMGSISEHLAGIKETLIAVPAL
jgi:uncharacterized protein YndB with AHSA1/START domain